MGKNFVLFLFLYMNAVRCLQRFAFSLLSGIGLSHDKHLCLSAKKVSDVCGKSFRCLQKNFVNTGSILYLSTCDVYLSTCDMYLSTCDVYLRACDRVFFLIKRTFSADIGKFFCRHRKLF